MEPHVGRKREGGAIFPCPLSCLSLRAAGIMLRKAAWLALAAGTRSGAGTRGGALPSSWPERAGQC